MDARRNPYAPGAGFRPPELSGRDRIIENVEVALARTLDGSPARSVILYGLRGVGKTVLLNEIRQNAETQGYATAWVEIPESRSLPASLAPELRAALIRLNKGEALRAKARDALGALGSFLKSAKLTFNDIPIGLDLEIAAGVADSGDLERDLVDVLGAIGEAARDRGTLLLLGIDELQYVPEDQLAALIAAFHRMSQKRLPVMLVAAGLPQLLGQMGRAKSYAERLFEFAPVDRLDEKAARDAVEKPAARHGVNFEPEAMIEILGQTQGYPYFLQEWGKHCWALADASPITGFDAERATVSALAELDASFFRVRFDRLTPTEKRYLRAMAELGDGPHRSGEIAQILRRNVTAVAPVRNSLIAKGMIYSPAHGDTSFTVPLFADFMRRSIPNLGDFT